MHERLISQAKQVLENNRLGGFTIPARGLYPNQVLWDSCFIAIGKSNYEIAEAQSELRSLLRGQWANGMMPNIIFNEGSKSRIDRRIWLSSTNENSPRSVATSGITQPPLLAIATQIVGQKLNEPERLAWYKEMLPPIIAYHRWLYEERDPGDEGLVVLVHPWETGLDTTPPWMNVLETSVMPKWIKVLRSSGLHKVGQIFRKDIRFVPENQRTSNIEALALFMAQFNLKKKRYDNKEIFKKLEFAVQDLTYNCILVRANDALVNMAKETVFDLPAKLVNSMAKTPDAVNSLCWNGETKQYYSRNYIAKELIKVPTIASFMPLYAKCVPVDRIPPIIASLTCPAEYGTLFPIPSVPVNSTWFKPKKYWQGPSWVNTNWFIVNGLNFYEQKLEASNLYESTVKMVEKSGFFEYFDSLTGEGAGADKFSWTAALIIDLLIGKQ
jgi:hypothetical protein